MSQDFYKTSILPYAPIIMKICRAYTDSQEDYEDYYQEICLQIWKSRNNFKGNSQWSTWIYRISLNVCLTFLKKKKRMEVLPSEEKVAGAVQEEKYFSDKSLQLLYAAIKQLSEIDRAVILLYLEEKSYQEISEILGTSSNNVGVRINRIKKRLKVLLDGKIN